MKRDVERVLMKLFMRTGNPAFYTARGLYKREEQDGRDDPDPGDRFE